MSDNTMVLPGDIPGLLRRGSPVLYDRERFHVSDIDISRDREDVYIARWAPEYWEYVGTRVSPASAALDLTDPTGRAHAAWWVIERQPRAHRSTNDEIVVSRACSGANIQVSDVATLRALVLRLAGRTA